MKTIFPILLCAIAFLNAGAQDTISIDFGKVIKKDLKRGAGSANLCWLMDSDLKRPNSTKSMQQALKELGAGSLRFPYGHLADNYLWNTPPFDDAERGLLPKVAAPSDNPGGWDWAVNEDDSFKSAMDFDEFMQLCQELDAKPLVVINVFSFKYEGGPTYERLMETAVEWVKYAKEKNYEVAYWQIGNEVDHHKDLLTMDAYVDFYQEVATAMKRVDPNINVGPGILSDVAYYDTLVSNYPELIDFTSCHQYAWPYIKSNSDYEKWKDYKDNYVPNVLEMQEAVSNSAKPDMDIVITETGLSPSGRGMGSINNTYKGLWYFEMLMNELSQSNVTYSYFWGTHSPWGSHKDNEDKDLTVLFRVDDNSRKPIAEAVKLVNDELPEHLVQTDQIQGYIRTFAGRDTEGENCRIFLMNRNSEEQSVRLQLKDLPKDIQKLDRIELKGTSPESREMNKTVESPIAISGNETELRLPPLSITVLKSD